MSGQRAAIWGLVVVGASLIAAGCSDMPWTDRTAPTPSGEYGIVSVDGLTVAGPASGGSAAAGVSGTLRLDERKCWMLVVPGNGEGVVVWPAGTVWSDPVHISIRLPSGEELKQGDGLTARGAFNQNIDRSSVSIAPDVACLQGATLTFATVDDIRVSSP